MKVPFLVFLFYSINLSANNLQYDTVTLQNYSVNDINHLNNFFADSPASVNVFVLENIEEHGIDSIQDITAVIPNFNFSNAGSRSFHSILGVRGLANTPFFSDPSVVLYIDDVPYGHTFSYSNRIYGVEKIEAYRGPQGASFGKNNYGGVLNVRSRKPGNQLKTHISGSYSRFNSWMTNAYIDGAIIPDKLFLSLGGAFSHSDGYLYNDFLNNTPDQENHLSGRAALAWQPNADWNISLMANGDDFKDATPHLISTHSKDSLTISSDQNGKLEQNANTLALRMQYQHKGLEFLSVTSHRDWQLKPFFMDIDLTPIPLLTTTINKRQTQWNQEFRVSSKYTDFAWSIGSFVSIGKNDSNGFTQVFGRPVIVYGGTTEDENYAVFPNLTYDVTDDFRIHTGLRLDYIYKEIDRAINTAPTLKKRQGLFTFQPETQC